MSRSVCWTLGGEGRGEEGERIDMIRLYIKEKLRLLSGLGLDTRILGG